jgi:hypothetical protein
MKPVPSSEPMAYVQDESKIRELEIILDRLLDEKGLRR